MQTERVVLGCLAAVLALAVIGGRAVEPAAGQRMEPAPEEIEDMGVDEHLGQQVPLDVPFVDSDRSEVVLGDFFDGTRPVILTLNYSDCPMLCSLQLNGLFRGLDGMKWDLGENFQMVTVSIDPKELPERAQLTKQKYMKAYARPGTGDGWRCLTGKEEDIRKVADAVGFKYFYSEDTGEYIHTAVTMILTPDGRVSRYLYGVEYDPQTIRLSLVEAAEGKIGSTIDRVLLFCFHYDETKGRYGPHAVVVMRVGGVLTVLTLVGLVLVFRRRGAAAAAREQGRGEDNEAETKTESAS